VRVIIYSFFLFERKGGENISIDFLFELLKEFVKAIVSEVSAYVFRKQTLEKR